MLSGWLAHDCLHSAGVRGFHTAGLQAPALPTHRPGQWQPGHVGSDYCHGWPGPDPWYSLPHFSPVPDPPLPMVSLPRSQPSGPFGPFLPSSPFLALFLFLSEPLAPAHPFLHGFPLSYLQLLLVFVLHLTPDPASLPHPAGGLTEEELMGQLEQCDLAPLTASRGAFPSPSPRTSLTR